MRDDTAFVSCHNVVPRLRSDRRDSLGSDRQIFAALAAVCCRGFWACFLLTSLRRNHELLFPIGERERERDRYSVCFSLFDPQLHKD